MRRATSTWIAALLGVALGYGLWLLGDMLAMMALAVRYWLVGWVAVLIVLVIAALVAARRTSHRAVAIAARWSLVGPVVVSLYVSVSLLV